MTTIQIERDEATWHEWRRAGIGGSDIAGLVLPSKWSSPWKVWAEKVGLLEPTETTQRQRIGQRMEAVLSAEFEDARPGLVVVGEQTWCEHAEHSWARCTTDGFVSATIPHGILGNNREIEPPFATVQFKTDARYGWPEGPPPAYRAQCIWEMGVTGMRHSFLAVMFGGFRFEVFDIPWDDDAQADWEMMFSAAESFWQDHVLTGEQPPVDGSDATSAALAAVYPEHVPGSTASLDGMAELLVERDDLKDHVKASKVRLDEIENAIKVRLGDAEVGEIAGVPIVTYRTQTTAGYWRKESTYRVLRNAPAPKKGKP